MKIAVAGGTGTVGSHVVDAARREGHDTVILTRAHGVDLRTGVGLSQALDGVEVVVDVANVASTSAEKSVDFFTTTAQTLGEAAAIAGVRHYVVLSIVGVDRAPEGYYAGKLAQEKIVSAGSVPWTIQRATQFHEFAPQIFANATLGPLHFAPRMRTQPVAAREVAERLVELAVSGPAGRVTDFGGPREESLVEMIRAYARAIGHRGWIPAISLPGGFGRAMRAGSMLPGAESDLGTQTYADWIAALPAGTRASAAADAPSSWSAGTRRSA